MNWQGLSLTLAAVLVLAGCAATPQQKGSPSPTLSSAPTATVSDEFGSIEGTIVSDEAAPIAGADVALQEPSKQTQSDASGKFTFNDLPPADYKLFAAKLGFESAAKSVAVTAGEVAKVSFTLRTISVANESFYVTTPYQGFMACSVSAFSPVNCGANGAAGEDKTSWIVDVDRTYPLKGAVINLVWQQASPATGNEMEIEFCDDLTNRQVLCAQDQVDGYYVYNDGPSPVSLRVTDIPKDAKQLLLGAGAKFGAQPIVQQKFTEYLTWCYVDMCADDFSAIPK